MENASKDDTDNHVETDDTSMSLDGEKNTEVLHIMSDNFGDSEQFKEDNTNNEANVEEKTERITQFPLSRIKHIMKMDPEVTLASQDAVFLVSKSTEMFVKTLVKESHYYTTQVNKKTIQKKDVEAAISNTDCLVFLDGALDS